MVMINEYYYKSFSNKFYIQLFNYINFNLNLILRTEYSDNNINHKYY